MPKEWVDDLMQLIGARDLQLKNIEVAQRLKQGHFPASLYKYREVNDYSLSNLRDATLHLTFARNFNDPYDSAVDFDPHFGSTQTEQIMDRIGVAHEDCQRILAAENPLLELVRYIYNRADAAVQVGEEELAKVANIMKDGHDEFIAKAICDLNSKIQNSYKICSLSERLDSLPLWAHYAKNHTGFAMEYDFQRLPLDHLAGLSLWPVRYSGVFDASEILRGVAPGAPFNNLFGLLATLHKSPDWAYEEEWRLVLIDGSDDPPRNLFAPLKAVYLGSKISEKDANSVLRNALFAGVPVFRMRLVPHEFRMEAVPYPVELDDSGAMASTQDS